MALQKFTKCRTKNGVYRLVKKYENRKLTRQEKNILSESITPFVNDLSIKRNDALNKLHDKDLSVAEKFGAGLEYEKLCNELIEIENYLNKNILDSSVIIGLFGASFKVTTKEQNRLLIYNTIKTYAETYASIPTKLHLAQATGLSRPTIDKHLKGMNVELMEFKENSAQLIKGVLGMLYKLGMQGDTKALKYFLDFHTKESNNSPKVSNTQNNYIQINNLKLTSEDIKGLPNEVVEKIEATIVQAKEKQK